MTEPSASRPHMPGYGILGPSEGSGLLPWSWAEQRLAASMNYWVVTLWPDGRPHAMPVWGVWDFEHRWLWFSSSLQSRKARNIAADGRCTVTTEDADEPVVLEGRAEIVTDAAAISGLIAGMNLKYSTDYPVDFLDPAKNATIRVLPKWAFALAHGDFIGSPTRWTFK